ncbi:atrophin-1-like [Panthera uncia]|uniref:atrophin-1-like n=1 Tax=Panthera uncia TaxID=29064 RepID=UPI0020FFAD07|nr:atrophin-1-like [Panthera uncia]
MTDGKEFGAQAPGTDGRFAGDSTDALAAGRAPTRGLWRSTLLRGHPETQSPALASPGPPARPGAGTQAQAAGAFSTRSAPSARGVRTDSWLRPASYRPGARADGSESPLCPAPRAPSRPPSGPPRVSSAPAGYHVPLNRGSAFCFQRRGAAATGHVERETSRRAREETNGHLKGQERGRERDHETAERDTADTGRSSPGSPREFQRLGPSAPNRDSAENTHLRVRVRPCAACPHRAGPPATRFAPPLHCGPSLHNKGYSF